MMENVNFFGVRHLSPAAAYQLRRKLDELQPEIVIVEGPSDFDSQMKWLCMPDVRFPLAIMAYTNEAPVQSVLYPLAVYSPEVQAILWAHEHGVKCRFMDLPSDILLAAHGRSDSEDSEDPDDTTEAVYSSLELLAGEDHDAFWERYFEQTEDYFSASSAFGRELRATAHDSLLHRAENTLREAYMKRVICEAAESGIAAEKVAVICGAFHVEGLKNCKPLTDDELKTLPRTSRSTTLMPYSYYRLSSRSGYGAGNQAPAYFELLWNCLNGDNLQSAAEQYLVGLAAAHRTVGNTVSSAEVIEALRLSESLCGLRGGKYPVLRDLEDAAVTTMGHGNYSELAQAFAQTEIGTAIGFLPEGIIRTAVQEDFYRQLKALNLEKYRVNETQALNLDLRERLTVKSRDAALLDLRRSFFLHRLRILGIQFATPRKSMQTEANWGEYWNTCWTPETEIQIAEASLHGETVEVAADFILRERAKMAGSVEEAALVFDDAFLCGIPDAAEYALRALQGLSIDSVSVTAAASAAESLSIIVRYGDLRQFDSAPVIPLIEQLYLRFCLELEVSCVCDGKASSGIIAAMNKINTLQLNHDFLDGKSWQGLLERISDRDDLNTKCSGYAMAILLERGWADETLLSREVARRLSPGTRAELGAGWFEGLAAKNHYALIARLPLWRSLSEYINQLDEPEFRRGLVFLRRAIADFTAAEKNDIAENLGEIWKINSADQAVNAGSIAESILADLTAEEKQMLDELAQFDFDDI